MSCYAKGSVNSAGFSLAGGFAGNHSRGKISNCYSTGIVTAEDGLCGGFVGIIYATITRSHPLTLLRRIRMQPSCTMARKFLR